MKHKQGLQKRVSSMGQGVGFGHVGQTNLPEIQQRPLPNSLAALIMQGQLAIDTKLYMLGKCSILVSVEQIGLHMSIAHPDRYPNWDEIAKARYTLLPLNKTFAMILPRPEDFVNVHRFCFQIREVPDEYARF